VHTGTTDYINELESRVMERERQVKELAKELKTLNTIQRRQERALDKYEGDDSHLPKQVRQLAEEIRVLREQLRQAKEEAAAAHESERRKSKHLQSVRDKARQLEALVKEKGLMERSALNEELEQLRASLAEQEEQLTRFKRKAELEEKERARAQGAHRRENNDMEGQVTSLRDEVEELRRRLADKDKQLHNALLRAPRAGMSKETSFVATSPLAHATTAAAATPTTTEKMPSPSPQKQRKRQLPVAKPAVEKRTPPPSPPPADMSGVDAASDAGIAESVAESDEGVEEADVDDGAAAEAERLAMAKAVSEAEAAKAKAASEAEAEAAKAESAAKAEAAANAEAAKAIAEAEAKEARAREELRREEEERQRKLSEEQAQKRREREAAEEAERAQKAQQEAVEAEVARAKAEEARRKKDELLAKVNRGGTRQKEKNGSLWLCHHLTFPSPFFFSFHQLRGLDGNTQPSAPAPDTKPQQPAAATPAATTSSSLPPWLQSKAPSQKHEVSDAVENLHRGKPARPDLLEDFRQSSQSSAQSSASGIRSRRSKESGLSLGLQSDSVAAAAVASPAVRQTDSGPDFLSGAADRKPAGGAGGGLDFLSQGPPTRRTRPSGGLDFLNDNVNEEKKPAAGDAETPAASRHGTATLSKGAPPSNLMDLFSSKPQEGGSSSRRLDETFKKDELGTSLLGDAQPLGVKARAASDSGGLPWDAPKSVGAAAGAGRRRAPVPGGPMAGALNSGLGGGRRPAGMKVARRVVPAESSSAGSGPGLGGQASDADDSGAPLFATPSKARAGRRAAPPPEDDGIEVIAL
jgi:hypothetical protein